MAVPRIIAWNELFSDEANVTTKKASYVKVYRAEFDEIPTLITSALSHPNCPLLYSPHPENDYAFLRELVPRRVPGIEHAVDIQATWETSFDEAVGTKGQPKNANPLKNQLEVEWDSWTAQEPQEHWTEYDSNYKPIRTYKTPIATTAGERILYAQEENYRTLKCTKNVILPDPIFAEGGTWVNTDKVTIEGADFEPLTMLATKVHFSKRRVENNVICRTMTWEYRHNPRSWIVRLDNVGYYHTCVVYEPGPNNTVIAKMAYQPIKVGFPPEVPSSPQPLLRINQAQSIINNVAPGRHGLNPAIYPRVPSVWQGSAPNGVEGAGVTNGNFYYGHVHPAFTRIGDEDQRIVGATLTASEVATIYEENRLYGLTRSLLSFKQYFPQI